MDSSELESRLRTLQKALLPLIQLVNRISRLETAFVSYIDPVAGRQQVVAVSGDGEINIVAGDEIDWHDSMCRLIFNDEGWIQSRVAKVYPDSVGAKSGMNTFFALPVQHNNRLIGSLCGTSVNETELNTEQYEQIQLIAEAVSWQVSQWQRLIKLQRRLQTSRRHLKQAFQDKESLRQLSEQDPLTGLLNRRGFADLWQSCIEQESTDSDISVMALDFDNFKQLNDNFGHQAGDDALKALANILTLNIRDYDFAARLGGDEFMLVLPTCKRLDALHISERIQQQYQATLHGQSHSISIGVAVSEQGASDDLLLLADKALYQAKNSGRGGIVVKIFRR